MVPVWSSSIAGQQQSSLPSATVACDSECSSNLCRPCCVKSSQLALGPSSSCKLQGTSGAALAQARVPPTAANSCNYWAGCLRVLKIYQLEPHRKTVATTRCLAASGCKPAQANATCFTGCVRATRLTAALGCHLITNFSKMRTHYMCLEFAAPAVDVHNGGTTLGGR